MASAAPVGDGVGRLIGYNRGMFRGGRVGLVAVLAIAIASVPLLLDQCAATCEMHHESVASAPSCHHSGTASAHLGQMPGTCGHDHNGTTVTVENGSIVSIRGVAMGVAIVMMPISPAMVAAPQAVHTHAPPDAPPSRDRRSLTLRI
jgi:hypothetical protein